jgi:kynurenine formamidase
MSALGIPMAGRVFSLDSGWWHAMPLHHAHPPIQILTYRTPHGVRVQRDRPDLHAPANSVGVGFTSEIVMTSSHAGTHIDALCHITCGAADEWFGGGNARDGIGDFGALSNDAARLPPIVARGVLLDVPAMLGAEHCAPHYRIGADELAATTRQQNTELRAGDVVLIRTGQMRYWPDEEAMRVADGSGLSLEGARWLAERQPIAVGADNAQVECAPSGIDGNPLPVHVLLIRDLGIPILEWIDCEELAAAAVHEFLFIWLPLTIAGATGSLVRPIAIA